MKVLIITGLSPGKLGGGVETFTRELINALKRSNIAVDILAGDAILNKSSFNTLEEFYLSFVLGKKANRMTDNYDVLISNSVYGAFIKSRVPRINIYHGTYYGSYKILPSLNIKQKIGKILKCYLEKESGKNAFNIAVSKITKSEVEKYYKNKVYKVINNSINVNNFYVANKNQKIRLRRKYRLPENKTFFLFSGRMEYRKGIDIFNEVAVRTMKKYPNAAFLILTPRINLKYKKAGLFYLIGDKKEKIKEVYLLSDVFLFPSRYEGYELVTPEALASGLCPIGAKNIGAMSAIPARNKILASFLTEGRGNMKEYIAKVEKYLGLGEKEKERIIREARNYAEKYGNKDVLFKEWIKIIKEVNKR